MGLQHRCCKLLFSFVGCCFCLVHRGRRINEDFKAMPFIDVFTLGFAVVVVLVFCSPFLPI